MTRRAIVHQHTRDGWVPVPPRRWDGLVSFLAWGAIVVAIWGAALVLILL